MEIYISQRKAATQLRCDGIFSKPLYYKFSAECARAGEKFRKKTINIILANEDMDKRLQADFLGHPVVVYSAFTTSATTRSKIKNIDICLLRQSLS